MAGMKDLRMAASTCPDMEPGGGCLVALILNSLNSNNNGG